MSVSAYVDNNNQKVVVSMTNNNDNNINNNNMRSLKLTPYNKQTIEKDVRESEKDKER